LTERTDLESSDLLVEPLERGAKLRRELVMKLPVPDLARDAGATLVVDTGALDLGGEEIAGPLTSVTRDPNE
jgi:hypothetical protein